MYRDRFSLLLLCFVVASGCSAGDEKKSLDPVVAHLEAKGFKGEVNPLQGDICGADEVLSFAGKDTNVKSRSASARIKDSSAGGNDFTAVLYLFSDADKASAYANSGKGVANGPFVIEIFQGDNNLFNAFNEYRP